MDRWAKAKSILTSMGSDVNGPTQPKDPCTITRRKIEKRDNEYLAIFVCLENFFQKEARRKREKMKGFLPLIKARRHLFLQYSCCSVINLIM